MSASLRVQEVATRFAVNADTVRHYVRIGLVQPGKDDSGYHRFNDEDLKVLGFILNARELGFTLDDIRQLLDDAGRGESPCPHARELIELRLSQARQKLASLESLVRRMEDATRAWEDMPDCEPCGEHICHLIEGAQHES
ncbi:MerR family transcriptional regulator [Thalassolituus sp.]|jgi:DNA-binding transcriptional MerR regulator|uniref:MerR family transcriptional regulator n=1 Tax=Thalassolituus sp. TaxID=2030822 RepID=UPI0035170A18|nr:MAG: MerR family transcriptional regulator [Thalassolituus sp.]